MREKAWHQRILDLALHVLEHVVDVELAAQRVIALFRDAGTILEVTLFESDVHPARGLAVLGRTHGLEQYIRAAQRSEPADHTVAGDGVRRVAGPASSESSRRKPIDRKPCGRRFHGAILLTIFDMPVGLRATDSWGRTTGSASWLPVSGK